MEFTMNEWYVEILYDDLAVPALEIDAYSPMMDWLEILTTRTILTI
jgi:hypothetical protein